MIWLLPHSSLPSPISKLERRHIGKRRRKRDNLLTGEGGGDGEGAKSYDGEEAWFSIIIQCSLAALLKVLIFERIVQSWARATVYLELNIFL
jgi:hypothetical protein